MSRIIRETFFTHISMFVNENNMYSITVDENCLKLKITLLYVTYCFVLFFYVLAIDITHSFL